jgi:hypothetical protein
MLIAPWLHRTVERDHRAHGFYTSDCPKRRPDIAAATSPFDPYDHQRCESFAKCPFDVTLKISMACWMVANEGATRMKGALARRGSPP